MWKPTLCIALPVLLPTAAVIFTPAGDEGGNLSHLTSAVSAVTVDSVGSRPQRRWT